MFEKELHIAKLIASKLQDNLTDQQQSELQGWIDANDDNRLHYQVLVYEEQLRMKLEKYNQIDSEAIYERVENGMAVLQQTHGERNSSRIVRLWPRIAVAAAVAIVIFGAGLFYFAKDSNKPEQIGAMAKDIVPGKVGATLTLANGKQIRLSDAANGELAKEAGVIITKTASGQLIYEIKDQNAESDKINILNTDNGETYQVRLPDGSSVWLNAASTLKYPASFAKHKDRRVALSGEAYLEVAKDKVHPFIVESNGQEVEVLGTHFNVNAYNNESAIKTTLLEGSVAISAGGKRQVIKPGEQAILRGQNLVIAEADVTETVAWKDGYFQYIDADIETIMRQLSRWYDVEVVFEGPITKETFTGRISRFRNISEALKIVQSSKGVHLTYSGRRIMVRQ